ncbi:cytochrome P450 [Xylariales sp. PMI_506]|nr:cytochrome P450 [Xylariales sp. PMI_506]
MDLVKAALVSLGSGSNLAQITIFTILALLSPFLLTYAYSSARSETTKRHDEVGQVDNPPPEAPYWIPYLGNALSFSSDTAGFIQSLKKRFGLKPVKLMLAGRQMTYVPHGDKLITWMLDAKELDSGPLAAKHRRDTFNFPKLDDDICSQDDSGFQVKPRVNSTVDPNKRISYEGHLIKHTMLNGKGMATFLEKTTEFLVQSLQSKRQEYSSWHELPDLSEFVRAQMFEATMRALCGNRIFEVTPNLLHDFWEFDLRMPDMFRGFPRWMAPKSHAARTKMVTNLRTWHHDPVTAETYALYVSNPESIPDWDPIVGHRLMVTHYKLHVDYGLSLDGRIAGQLGLIWGAMTNLITSIIWPIFHAVLSPSVAERVLIETSPYFTEGLLDVQRAKLSSCNLLNSMYMESLRFGIAVSIARAPWAEEGYKLGDWTLKKDEVVFTISAVAHLDETFWNSGYLVNGKPEHPTNEFWAERFLEYPGDPLSGPIKKYNNDAEVYRAAKQLARRPEDDARAKLITHGLSSHYFPYGGGVKICPGRYFAKQLILAAVPMFLRAFEIEYLDPKAAAETKPDYHYFMFSSLAPDRKNPVRIRARKL